MSKLEAVALLAWREHGLETQRYMLILPLPWQDAERPGIKCLIDINLLGAWLLWLGPWGLEQDVAGDGYCALSHEGIGASP